MYELLLSVTEVMVPGAGTHRRLKTITYECLGQFWDNILLFARHWRYSVMAVYRVIVLEALIGLNALLCKRLCVNT